MFAWDWGAGERMMERGAWNPYEGDGNALYLDYG